MSERILKALMQLFAIVANPNSNAEDRRAVVRSFLNQQLNSALVEEYLEVFDNFFETHQKKKSTSTKRKKQIAASSVKVIMIATVINEELSQKEKIVVLMMLLEFIKSEGQISDQEYEFVTTVSDTFNIPRLTFDEIHSFIVNSFAELPDSEHLLLIDSTPTLDLPQKNIKKLTVESLKGQIRVLQIELANMYVMRFASENELYLNGQLMQQNKVYVISNGSSIRNPQIKPIYYSDIASSFSLDTSKPRVVLEATNLKYIFKEGKVGLHNINFLEKSGKLIGIMGASGTGKSTLLNVLNGSDKPTSGEVLINGINIHKEPERVEGIIGHVSQDDLLIEELTVFENLYYNAKLCFDNYTTFQLLRAVLRTLKSLGLYEIRNMKVGSPLNKKISGGQRKRLNIALELIREPAVMFLDEPTSGLSSRDSENILDLLKELALKGKLVFVVIHQPSSDIFKMFDRLLILDQGGFLIYNGDPVDSIIYFKSRTHQANWSESECHCCGNVNPEQVFNIVEAKVIDEYGQFTHTRKITPTEWNKHFIKYTRQERKRSVFVRELPDLSFKIPGKFKQWWVFTQRDLKSKMANRQYKLISFLEAPLLAFLLSYIIKFFNVDVGNEYGYNLYENSNLPVYIFMAVIIALFLGLTGSAQEIIKDRLILKREEFLNLSRASYLLSKVSILFGISAIQALLFTLVGNFIIEIKGMYFEYWLALFSTWAFANMLGLIVSDSFKTTVTIHILIPFLIIPQIILSGIIVRYDKLNPNISSPSSIPFYGEIITARWAYEALAVYQFKNNKFQRNFYDVEKEMSNTEYKKNYWLKTLENNIVEIERNFKNPEKEELIRKNLKLLRNEVVDELQINYSKLVNIDKLYYEELDKESIENLKKYFSLLKKHYIKRNNEARQQKDEIINQLQTTAEAKDAFLRLKKEHHNESLTEFVTNSNDLISIIEYKDRLYQKSDPIYKDSSSPFIKSHFYAAQKPVFGNYFSTYWINIVVIWISTISLYIVLYYSGLKRFLNGLENLNNRIKNRFGLEEN